MMKNKVFIIINVLGMGVAIACCIIGYFAYEYDATFDASHQNSKELYRVSSVREFDKSLTRFGYAPLPLREVIAKNFPDVENSTRYVSSGSNFKLKEDLFASNLSYVDQAFFKMFTFKFIVGNPNDLNDKSSVFLSETMAVRLFNSPKEALGKTITQVYGKELKEVRIAGVFEEQPMNSSFRKRDGSSFMQFDNYKEEYAGIREEDWRRDVSLFVQINDATRVGVVHKQLQQYIVNNNKVREDFQVKEFTLDPLTTMAHRDRDESVKSVTADAPPLSAIIGSIIMSVLVLLISCFNLTNTAIAISSRRIKEIGIRKVMGSQRIQLIVQFLSETTTICFLALILGLGMADLLAEGWNLMTANNIQITPHYLDAPRFIIFLILVLLFTGIVAGSYPAFYISKFKPVSILKGKLQLGGTNYFTRSLLGLQFTISLIAIVSAFGFLHNAHYQQQYDLGFDVRGSVVTYVNGETEFNAYRNALQQNPVITSIAGARSGIFSNRSHEPVKYQSSQSEVDIIQVGDNYLNTMDLKLVEGRDFTKNSETDRNESIIVTQNMVELFGWDKPLGKEIIWKDSVKLYVVGVVKDVYTRGLWYEMEPMMIRYVLPDQYTQLVVSADEDKLSSMNIFMNDQWNKIFPNRLYNGYLLSSVTQQANTLNMSIVYGYTFLGVIAMLLSATGLYTLVSLNMIRRMKEIGIRKIVGASVSSIMTTINKEFVIILAVASLLGAWAGYAWCNAIMSTIWKYYQSVNTMTFVVSVILMFAVSFATIGYKVFSIATMNPVDSLRDE